MRQKTLASSASFEGHDRETQREEFLDRTEVTASWTEPRCLKLDDLRRLAWLGIKLCNAFVQRWLNLCEVGVEEVFFGLTMLRSFAGVDLGAVTAPRETAILASRSLMEAHDSLRPASSPEMLWGHSNSTISWKTPWLYLVFPLLVWLLLF